jgi:hypothetical protein
VLTALSWQPANAPPPRRPSEPAHPELALALAERDTVIVLVVGAGPASDRAEQLCQGLAHDPGFETVRVVRLHDRTELTPPQRTWLAGGRHLTVLGPDRRIALPLERVDAVDLFVAVSALG